jgi:hypothetical protein
VSVIAGRRETSAYSETLHLLSYFMDKVGAGESVGERRL